MAQVMKRRPGTVATEPQVGEQPVDTGTPHPPGAAGEKHRNLIHPLSAVVLMGIDALWSMDAWAVFAWMLTIPASFLATFIPAYFIQKNMNGDTGGRAALVAAMLGFLAAIPSPVMGTAVGFAVLALAGLRGGLGGLFGKK
jgi:hypothetical protein